MKCFAGDSCIFAIGDDFGHLLSEDFIGGEDVIVIITLRGQYPVLFADLVTASVNKEYKIYHTDCANKMGVIKE